MIEIGETVELEGIKTSNEVEAEDRVADVNAKHRSVEFL